MKTLYLSQPVKKDKEQEIRLAKKAIMQLLKSKEIVLDQNHMYQWVANNYPTIDTFIPKFTEYMDAFMKRIPCIKNSDFFIFIEQWKDYPECKLDLDILNTLGISNILELRLVKDKSGNISAKKVL